MLARNTLKSILQCRSISSNLTLQCNRFQIRSMSSNKKQILEDGELLKKINDLVIKNNLAYGENIRHEKVVNFKHPEDLQSSIDFSISSCGVGDEKQIDEILESVVKYSVKARHPHFYNQLYGGIDEHALAGAWLTEALNTNQHTFEVAPVFVLMEYQMIKEILKMFGWNDGDGIFNAGGSMSNIYGMNLARYKKYPDLKTTGLFTSKPLVTLTSDQSHYSANKASALLGHGLNQVEAVKTDSQGRMTAAELKKCIVKVRESGRDPFFVNATCGTTVFGAYDPLEELADVCEEENIWLHVDACWGGSAMLSKKYKHLMKGIERADSIAWNPHKMLGVSLQCSPFIVKYKGLLHEAHSSGATYLFQQDKIYDVTYDLGDKSVQCGRKPDAFKLWMLFKFLGYDELGRRIENAFSAAEYLSDKVKEHPNFRPVLSYQECTNNCFWYIPPSLQGLEENEDWWKKISQVAPKIKSELVLEGTLLVGYQPVPSKGLVNFFRMINTAVPAPTTSDMDFVIDEIHRIGQTLKF